MWGSMTLNHRHNEIEEKAKKEHPKESGNIALNYETIADKGSSPEAGMSEKELVTTIYAAMKKEADKMVNVKIPDKDDFSKDIRIAGEEVGTFRKTWSTAVGVTGTRKVTVKYRGAKKDGEWETEKSESKTDEGGKYSLAFREGVNMKTTIEQKWHDTSGGRSSRRKTPSSKGSP